MTTVHPVAKAFGESYSRLSKRLDRQHLLQSTCAETICRPEMRHGVCEDCGRLTDASTIRIEERTLRRKKVYVCSSCERSTSPNARRVKERQVELRAMRTRGDWTRVTDPIETTSIVGEVMPEQYASRARAAVRAFFDAGFDVATVGNSDASTMNAAIGTLGLADSVYVEVRNGDTILRRLV